MKIILACEAPVSNLESKLLDVIKNEFVYLEVLCTLSEPDWLDDTACLIIVPYENDSLSPTLAAKLQNFLGKIDRASVLPVCLAEHYIKPPKPVAAIRGFHYRSQMEATDLMKRIKCYVALKLIHPTGHTFISYRTKDGLTAAKSLKMALKNQFDFNVTLDVDWPNDKKEEKLTDQEIAGIIDPRLKKSAFLFIILTPDLMPEDEKEENIRWVKYELDVANEEFIPVLPICFSTIPQNHYFAPLSSTPRKLEYQIENPDKFNFSVYPEELNTLVNTIEDYLADVYYRRNLIMSKAENIFVKNAYTWQEYDTKKRMYKSEVISVMTIKLLSHCSISDIYYIFSVYNFIIFFSQLTDWASRYNFFIYSDRSKGEDDIQNIYGEALAEHDNLKILHVAELAIVLEEL